MPTEQSATVRRAALHAALADEARLEIVDRLALGDVTPGELQLLLGRASNLVAHHLGVLEDAGVVRRHRSQADRRHTYVQLVPGVLEGLLPTVRTPASRVLFVCTANSARSQLAAALWRQSSRVPVTSAGTHPAERIAPGALAVAARHRLPMRRSRPRALPDAVDALSHDALLVTVCDSAREDLRGRLRSRSPRAVHWSVPDPVAIGTDRAFDEAYDELARRVAGLASRLVPADVDASGGTA